MMLSKKGEKIIKYFNGYNQRNVFIKITPTGVKALNEISIYKNNDKCDFDFTLHFKDSEYYSAKIENLLLTYDELILKLENDAYNDALIINKYDDLYINLKTSVRNNYLTTFFVGNNVICVPEPKNGDVLDFKYVKKHIDNDTYLQHIDYNRLLSENINCVSTKHLLDVLDIFSLDDEIKLFIPKNPTGTFKITTDNGDVFGLSPIKLNTI